MSGGVLSTQRRLNSDSAPVRGEGPEDGHRPLLSPHPLSPHLVLATSLPNILAHSHLSPLALTTNPQHHDCFLSFYLVAWR